MTETVLIVEDQAGLAEAYSCALEESYETRVAHSGTEALEYIDSSVDAMILDRRMPGMSGDELLAELSDEHADIAVAMVTAVDPGTDIVDMQIDNYVTKPISNDELVALVDELVEHRDRDEHIRAYRQTLAKKRALENSYETESDAYETLVDRLEQLRNDTAVPDEENTELNDQSWLD